MLIDVHAHIAYHKMYPDEYLLGMLKAGDSSRRVKEKMLLILSNHLNDRLCGRLTAQMQTAGVAKVVLLIIDGGVGMEKPQLEIEEIFELHHHVLAANPDKFLVFGGVDPRRGTAGFELFRRGLVRYGFRGLKLYPPMGYAPDDDRLSRYYELCREYACPVLIHTGPSLPFLQNHLADPARVVNVAQRYPEVNFIMAHAGLRLRTPAIAAATSLPNVYLDIAGFQPVLKSGAAEAIEELGLIFDERFNGKVLFGSDWPLFHLMDNISAQVGLLRRQFGHLADKYPLALENVLYHNANQLLFNQPRATSARTFNA